MNNKLLGIGILFVLLAAGTAFAFRGDIATGLGFDSEARNQIQTAIENGDYTTWKSLQEQALTEENFNAIRERMQERTQDMEQMQQNREEMQAQNQEIQSAIENGDYATWKALMEESSNPRNEEMLSVITEENFSLFSEMHSAMQSGDIETAKTIMEELGIQGLEKNGFMGKGMPGMHKGFGMKGNFGDHPSPDKTTE